MKLNSVWPFILEFKKSMKKSTLLTYKRSMTHFNDYFVEVLRMPNIKVNSITPLMCQGYTNFCRDEEKFAANTVKNRRKRVSMCFNILIAADLMAKNPMMMTKILQPKVQTRIALNPEQYDSLFNVCETDEETLLLSWIFAGIRFPSEYLLMKPEWIYLENEEMKVFRAKTNTITVIPIMDKLLENIKKAIAEGRDLFPFRTNTMIIRKKFKELCVRTGIIGNDQDFPYIGRHTLATKMYAEYDYSSRKLCRLMGWSGDGQIATYVNDDICRIWERIILSRKEAEKKIADEEAEREMARRIEAKNIRRAEEMELHDERLIEKMMKAMSIQIN